MAYSGGGNRTIEEQLCEQTNIRYDEFCSMTEMGRLNINIQYYQYSMSDSNN